VSPRLLDVVSGIHILPFYPCSSDDGFAGKDYFAVNPGYGTWHDLARLGTDFDLMAGHDSPARRSCGMQRDFREVLQSAEAKKFTSNFPPSINRSDL